jgi:acetyl/propionyl-CoA carboxylase alpha subunit
LPTRLSISGDLERTVEIDGDRVTIDGVEPLVVRPGENGRLVVTTSRGDVAAIAATSGDVVWVGVDGHVFELKARQGPRRRPMTTADEDALSAPMPATVVRILVQPGTRVAAGDLLVALEAMKMELGIRAPHDGVVAAIHCREGELVQPGTPLVEMGSYLFSTGSPP